MLQLLHCSAVFGGLQSLALRAQAATIPAPPWAAALALQFKTFKLVYRRYAGLYFVFCIDVTDNELLYLESIHLFVEVRRWLWGWDRVSSCAGIVSSGGAHYLAKAQEVRADEEATCMQDGSRQAGARHVGTMHPGDSDPIPLCLSAQILDEYFGNVCELDLVFGFHKVGGGLG